MTIDSMRAVLRRAGRSRRAQLLAAFVVAWALLELAHPFSPLHADTFEDLLLARECAEEGRCSTAGVSTAFDPIEQGALWINFLAALRALGLSIASIRSVTFAMGAASVAVVLGALGARGSPRLAWATAALVYLELVVGESLEVLWNPSLTPLPAALLFAACLRHADLGRWWTPLPLAAALGLTVETHPVAALAIPGALFVAGVGMRRRTLAIFVPAAAGAGAAALHASISPRTALLNASWALDVLTLPGMIAGAVAITAAAAWLQPRFLAASDRARGVAVSIALAGPPVAAIAIAWLVTDRISPGARYLAPVFPAVAYAMVEGLAPLLRVRAVSASLALGAAAITVLASVQLEPAISQEGLESAAVVLRAEGVSLDDAWAHVSGPECAAVLGGFAALGLPIAERSERPDDQSWFLRPASDLQGADLATLERGRWRAVADGELVLGELDTFLDRRRFSVCVFEEDPAREPTCVDRDLGAGIRALTRGERVFSGLEEPSIQWHPDTHGPAARRAIYRLRIDVPARASRRTLSISRAGQSSCLGVRFLAVEGARTGSTLPADELVVLGADEAQRGVVIVEVDGTACSMHSLPIFPPCVSEIAPEDGPALRRLLRGE